MVCMCVLRLRVIHSKSCSRWLRGIIHIYYVAHRVDKQVLGQPYVVATDGGVLQLQ